MHPHRGIETITYMIEGSFTHKDSRGGGGLLKAGEVQWMTAGKGILHEEMPAMESGSLWGYQLWLNLPKKYKWVDPRYQQLSKEEVPVYQKDGIKVIIISGEYEGINGPAENYVPAEYYDVYLENNSIQLTARKRYNSIIYIHSGTVIIQDQKIRSGNLVEFFDDKTITIESGSDKAGFLFLSSIPNNEPYSRAGPFVMNTKEEILQAFEDYQKGRLFQEEQ